MSLYFSTDSALSAVVLLVIVTCNGDNALEGHGSSVGVNVSTIAYARTKYRRPKLCRHQTSAPFLAGGGTNVWYRSSDTFATLLDAVAALHATPANSRRLGPHDSQRIWCHSCMSPDGRLPQLSHAAASRLVLASMNHDEFGLDVRAFLPRTFASALDILMMHDTFLCKLHTDNISACLPRFRTLSIDFFHLLSRDFAPCS